MDGKGGVVYFTCSGLILWLMLWADTENPFGVCLPQWLTEKPLVPLSMESELVLFNKSKCLIGEGHCWLTSDIWLMDLAVPIVKHLFAEQGNVGRLL